ncbi:hypothetical protein NMG60_11002760 [Bertholletia excelsa]
MAETHHDLPDECWELIFDRLDHHSQLEPLSLVCKRFLSVTDQIRTSLAVVKATVLVHGSLSGLFGRFRNLKSLDFSRFGGDLDLVIREIAGSNLRIETVDVSRNERLPLEGLRALVSNMPSLRVLNCAFLGRFCDAELIAMANSMPWLVELNFSFPKNDFELGSQVQAGISSITNVTDSGIEELASKLKGLRKINISGNYFLSDRSLVALSTNCSLLTEIKLLDCPFITQNGIQFLMSHSPNLSSVSMGKIQCQRPFSDMSHVDSFTFARCLSTLEIYDSSVSDENLCLLAKSGVPLKSFVLSYCSSFTFSGVSFLLQAYQSLEYLGFIHVDILTDEHVGKLTKYLHNLISVNLKLCFKLTIWTFLMLARDCPLLEDIDMCNTDLGKGKRAVEVLKNTRIKTLKIGSNPSLSDECLGIIASICPSVELLDLSFCSGITENGITQFLNNNSKVRQIQIGSCREIESLGTGPELPKLEVLQASGSAINDRGLAIIGNRCCGLENLDLEGCLRVTPGGLKELLTNCKRLREINLNQCVPLSVDFIAWIVFSRPALRKIILPCSSSLSASQSKFFLHHGCLVYKEDRGKGYFD